MAETAAAGALQIMNDVPLFISGPALSATSDNPNIVREQQNAPALSESKDAGGPGEGEKPAEVVPEIPADDKPAVEKKADEADTGKPGEEVEDHDKEHKPDLTPAPEKAWMARERKARQAAERKAEESQRMLSEALETMKRMVPQPVAEPVKATPKRDDYEDPDAYAEAKASFLAEQAVATKIAEFRQQEVEKQQEQAKQQYQRAIDAFVAKGQDKYPDFEEKCLHQPPSVMPVSEAMRDAVFAMDDGQEVLYHLADNPDEARKIFALPTAAQQALAMGRIETKLKAPPPAPKPKPTAAPAPIKPVNGGASAAVAKSMYDPDYPMADYEKQWKKDRAKDKGIPWP